MTWLRLGSLSVGALTTSILLGLITGYLLALKGKSPDTWYLTGYIATLLLLLMSYTIRYSIFSAAGLFTGQVSNFIVFGVVCLVQFAYHYGGCLHKKESRLVLYLFLMVAIAAWISNFFRTSLPAVYDFQAQYFTYEYGPRISVVTLAGYLWAFVVLMRKTVLFTRQAEQNGKGRSFVNIFIKPAGRKASSTRSFALLTMATALIALLYLLFQTGVISRAAYVLVFNSSSLMICLLIFIVYINNAPQPTSFRDKLVGIPLATIMVTFGIISSALVPVLNSTLADRYRIEVELVRNAFDRGDFQGLSHDLAYVLPVSPRPGSWSYTDPTLPVELRNQVASTSGEEGLLQERSGLKPGFFYLDLEDTSTFFFQYELSHAGQRYRIGFRYAAYRLAVHLFLTKLVAIALGVALFVVLGFPLVFKRGLLAPLSDLLEAVRQVETGNYGLSLPVTSEDEVGRLALGYNRMVKSLKNAEGNFKALAENANDAILILSKEGRVVYTNTRAAGISGYSPVELRKKHFSDIIHPDELAAVERRFAERMDGRTAPRCYESVILNRKGEVVPVEITGARTIWHDEPADVVIIRDISERKRAEELLQAQQQQLLREDKLASLGALVAGVAHEVNNPNQAVSMNARFLGEGLPGVFVLAESGEQVDDSVRIAGVGYSEFKQSAEAAISEISAGTARIDHIVRELKSFVGGEVKGLIEPTDVNQVIRTVVDLSRHLIRKATGYFALNLNQALPRVEADRIRLEQVVLNLVQNACQSLPDRNRSVTVSTRHDRTSNTVLIEVADQGIGIPEADLDLVSDPFFTTRRSVGGTGLGLSVSSRIVRDHGGTLSFRSQVGRGTTAVVSLPACNV